MKFNKESFPLLAPLDVGVQVISDRQFVAQEGWASDTVKALSINFSKADSDDLRLPPAGFIQRNPS